MKKLVAWVWLPVELTINSKYLEKGGLSLKKFCCSVSKLLQNARKKFITITKNE